jgi:hypothetical protein
LALLLAGSWFLVHPSPARVNSKALAQILAELSAAARSGDSASFFELARATLLHTFATRWRLPPDQITTEEFRARLGPIAGDFERLWALADEAKYSKDLPGTTDFQHWLALIRAHAAGEKQ